MDITFIFFWLIFALMTVLSLIRKFPWYYNMAVAAVLTVIVSGAAFSTINTLVVRSPEEAFVGVGIYFVCFVFLQALRDTGVIEGIVTKVTAMCGGQKLVPVLALVTLFVWGSLIFGPAAVPGFGVVIIPILMGLGIDNLTASLVYGASWTMAYTMWKSEWLNLVTWSGVVASPDRTLANSFYSSNMTFVYMLFAAFNVIGYAFIIYRFYRTNGSFQWVSPRGEVRKIEAIRVPIYCYLLPVLPLALILLNPFQFELDIGLAIQNRYWRRGYMLNALLAYIISTFAVYFVTYPGSGRTPRDLPYMMEKSFFQGGEAVCTVVLVGIAGCFMAGLTYLAPAFNASWTTSFAAIAPTSFGSFTLFFSLLSLATIFNGPGSIIWAAPVYTALSSMAAGGQLGPVQPQAIWGAMLSLNCVHLWANPFMYYTTWTCAVTATNLIDIPRTNLLWAWAMSVVGVLISGMNYIG
jgi:hypothetical protein